MSKSKKPIFYTGGGVINSGPKASELLRELVAATGFPITSTLQGLGCFPGYDNTVIYIKNGPVRVHGTYKGRYTIVTDEYTTYRRHAWPEINSPIDTIWNNIWVTDDLINVDAVGFSSGPPLYVDDGNLEEFQPGSGCEGGSDNIMGLVSGANIYIANTLANGAVNRQNDSHVVINAGLIALNESFVVQYWQNSTNSVVFDPVVGNQITQEPPWGDARGDEVGTIGSSGANDLRGMSTFGEALFRSIEDI